MKKLLTLVPCVVFAACSADPQSSPVDTGAATAGEAGDIQAGLRLGDTGPAVRELNELLSQSGYFPNAELRETYGDWTPVIPREPAAMDRFDEVMESGVRAYQARRHLEVNGVVDEATAKALSTPGCGFPEYGNHDASWKFALMPGWAWKRFSLTWKLAGGLPPNLSDSVFDTKMKAAFKEWTDHSTFTTFRRVATTAAADIVITFGKLSANGEEPAGKALARATPDYDPVKNEIYAGRINFRSTLNWGDPNGANFQDFGSVALHEIGHVLALHHSDPPDSNCSAPGQCPSGPVMWYLNNLAPSLRDDDLIAIHAKYPGYYGSGSARALAAGGDGSVWFLGMNALAKGFEVYKWTPARQWETVSSQGAVSIGVEGNGVAWAADNTGQIYFSSVMGWLPMGAPQYSQVAAGTDQIWALHKTRDANGEANVYQFDGWDFQLVSGFKATNIAVDSRGRAWILRKNRDVYRRDGSTWTKIPKQAPPLAANLRAGANGAIFVNAPTGSVWKTYIWNQQEGYLSADGEIDIPAREEWLMVPGAASTHDDPAASTYETTSAKDGRFWSISAQAGFQNRVWFSIR